jgi:hypothetical protein
MISTLRIAWPWRATGLLALGMGVSLHAWAQDWEKKNWERWSRKDCEKLLRDSPWAKTWERTRGAAIPTVPIRATYVAQLWSVRFVRQAVVRTAQLDLHRGSLSAEQKKAQEAEEARFIGAESADSVVVQIVFGTNSAAGERELRLQWQKLSLAALKETVYLESPRGRVALAGYTPPEVERNEFQFVFPRTINGRPIVEEGDAFLRLGFVHPITGVLAEVRVVIEFNPKEMSYEGKLLY